MTTANEQLAVIDQGKDLAHLNELVAEITGLKEGYKDLKIKGPEDKEGYELVRAAIGKLRPKRTSLEAERKSVVRPYNETVKFINGEYEKITDLIQSGPGGELELKEKKQVIDDLVERQVEEEKQRQEQIINARINEILKYMQFDGSYYSIKDEALGISETSIGVVEIRTMSTELFSQFFSMVIEKAGKIAAEKERVALEEKQKEELRLAKEKEERDEFLKQKAEMDRLQKEMQEQKDAMKKQQEEMAAQQKKIEDEKNQQEQNRINNIIRHRSAVLTGIELEYNANNQSFDYQGEVLIADASGIADHDDVDWLDLLDKLKAIIAGKKFAAEEFLKQQKKDEEIRIALQEKERQAALKDKDKMKEYTAALLAVPVPEFNTKAWKTKAGFIRDYITDNVPA